MAKSNYVPIRMCVVCMQHKPKAELIRLVKTKQGKIIIDHTQKTGGYGVWVDKSPDCIAQLKKRKSLERKFKCAIPEEVFEELNKTLNEWKSNK